jgi:hypothetical protein
MDTPDKFKTIFVYFGSKNPSADLHGLVARSYSKSQLIANSNEDVEDSCKPLVRFRDLKEIFGEEINRAIKSDSRTQNIIYSQDQILFPCGFRPLTTIMRTKASFPLPFYLHQTF